jgi:prolyl oligopeptidase
VGTLGSPESNPLYQRILSILDSKDKIPHVRKIGDFYYNFWQDENNKRGLLRRTTLMNYKSPNPRWQTVLDIDELGKKENESWVYKGYTLYKPDDENEPATRILLELSRGGADATVVREFDLQKLDFVPASENPFYVPEAKSRVSWKSRDVLLIGTDLKDGESLTESGYPRVVREWVRGTPLESSHKVYEGEKSDVSVGGYVVSQ